MTGAKTQQFTGTGTYAETVTWKITVNNDEGTAISDSGLLTLSAAETVGTITVTATSTEDASKSGTAIVTVTAVELTAIPSGLEGLSQAVFSTGASYALVNGVYWADRFAIDIGAKMFRYYMDTGTKNYWGGTVYGVMPDAGSEPAKIIVKVTEVAGDGWTEAPAEVGKYLVYAYKNLAGNIVSASTPNKDGGKNTGVDTVAEALSEYTNANGYYAHFGTYNIYPEVPDTSGIEGQWLEVGDMEGQGYNIIVSGNTYLEWMDFDDDLDGIYDPDDDEYGEAVFGIIVECSDTSQASGIMYVQVVQAMMHTPLNFAAIAWRAKESGGIEFATANDSFYSVENAKAEYDDPSDYADNNFYIYEKQ